MHQEHGIDVVWRALPLHEEIPEEGMSLEEFIGDPYADISGMLEKFRHAAEECGLPFAGSRMIYNTRAAQELRAWAHETYHQGDAFEAAAFAAYFVEGSNLALPEVLRAIVRRVGLPEDEALDVLRTRSFSDRIDRDLAQAKKLGIMSAPTFMAHGKRLVGAHLLNVLKDFAMGNILLV